MLVLELVFILWHRVLSLHLWKQKFITCSSLQDFGKFCFSSEVKYVFPLPNANKKQLLRCNVARLFKLVLQLLLFEVVVIYYRHVLLTENSSWVFTKPISLFYRLHYTFQITFRVSKNDKPLSWNTWKAGSWEPGFTFTNQKWCDGLSE